MVCPQCNFENSVTSVSCVKCATPLPLSEQTLATGGAGWSVPAGEVVVAQGAMGQLAVIAGEAQLKKGNARDAINTFQEAQKLANTWLGHFDLGKAYLATSSFTEASSEFDICLKRRGEATSVVFDDVPSYHMLPPVFYYQGRAREGLNSPGAAESYKTFLSIKEKGAGDPLVADAERRISRH